MKETLKISVYITSYNQKGYLCEAIESVLNQTLRPFEIIIIDDFSHDGSQNIIASYALKNPDLIRPIYNDRNLGISQTRNKALSAVRGDYVTYLDGDDKFLPRKLETESRCIALNPDTHIVFSNFYSIDESGEKLWVWIEDQMPPQGNIFVQTFAKDFPKKIHFRNELVSYEAIKNVDFYDTNLTIYEDYDIRIRLTKKYRAVFNNEPCAEYRRHSAGLSISQNIYQHIRDLEYLYTKNLPLLNDLNSKKKKYVRKEINENIARIIRGHSMFLIGNNYPHIDNRIKAFKLYLKSFKYSKSKIDAKSLAKLLLHQKIYWWFEKNYMKLKKITKKQSAKN